MARKVADFFLRQCEFTHCRRSRTSSDVARLDTPDARLGHLLQAAASEPLRSMARMDIDYDQRRFGAGLDGAGRSCRAEAGNETGSGSRSREETAREYGEMLASMATAIEMAAPSPANGGPV
jgi:hypothetical protein